MAWTQKRVEILKKRWAEGVSAGGIAKELGGVTRNAVIGKVHRMGLSDSTKPSASAEPYKTPSAVTSKRNGGNGREGMKKLYNTEPKKKVVPKIEAKKGQPKGVVPAILHVKDSMCKWPLNNPSSPEFHFCGRPTDPGQTYCTGHSDMAYQPRAKQSRRRPSGAGVGIEKWGNF